MTTSVPSWSPSVPSPSWCRRHSPGRSSPETAALPVPPRATPSSIGSGGDVDDLTACPATVELLPGAHTPIWRYDGDFPDPTIVARRDRQVLVRLRAELPVPTVLHLHGGSTPPESDGFPADLVPVGWTGGVGHDHAAIVATGSREYRYPNRQPAATLWYHDHRMDFTAPHVWRGLFGASLIRDDAEDALGLPSGEQDLPLLICAGTGPTAQAMRFRGTGLPSDDFAWKQGMWTINGALFDPSRPDATPWLGQLERWTLTSDAEHPVHVHAAPFQIVSRTGGLAATDRGWKDTVPSAPPRPWLLRSGSTSTAGATWRTATTSSTRTWS